MRKLSVAVLLLLIVVIGSACGGLKTKQVDLVDYVNLEFDGLSTEGVVYHTIDIEQAIADVHG